MQRFKAWLFVWLMGEHFAEIERDVAMLRKSHEAVAHDLNSRLGAIESALNHSVFQPAATVPTPKKKVIQSRNWADFQRLAGDSDQEVQ